MESLASVLRRIPLFATLPPGSLARIIADLREEHHASGAVICFEGDEARDFYIVKSGQLEISVHRGGNLRDRLYGRNQELSKVQSAFGFQIEFFFRSLSAARQALLIRTAILPTLEPGIVAELTGQPDAAAELAAIASESPFIIARDGTLSYPEAVRDFLLGRLASAVELEGVRALHARAAQAYAAAGRWDQAIDHHLAAAQFGAAAGLLAAHADEGFKAGRLDVLRNWLERFPPTMAAELVPLRQRLELALNPAAALTSVSVRGTLFGKFLSAEGKRWLGAAIGVTAARHRHVRARVHRDDAAFPAGIPTDGVARTR